MTVEYKEMGQRIRKARKEKTKLNQEEMADRLGTSRSTYAQYEAGRTPIQTRHIPEFCSLTNTRSEWILTGAGAMNSDDLFTQVEDLWDEFHEESRQELIDFMEGMLKVQKAQDKYKK